jgi:transposase
MRGEDRRTGALFSYVDLESRVRGDHPLRSIREIVNAALAAMSSDFEALYSRLGRPGIAPERLLRALLLQCFYSVRSERQLMERLEFDLLFRWFVGLGVDDPVWDASTFSKNRDRLLAGEVAQRFLAELLALPEVRRLLSAEHFSVDGTLLQAWASQKSFRRKDGEDEPPGPGRNGERGFRGEKRSNASHASTTDPDARLYRKGNGQPAELCYIGHALMENRNGLIVGGVATRATGDAEPLAAIELVKAVAGGRRVTLGADKAYDTANFVMECREEKVTPHVAQNITATRGSRIDGRTTRHPAMRPRFASASGSRRASAGRRRSPASPRSSCAASPASTSPSSSPSPPTTSCGCRSCWRGPRHDRTDGLPADRPVADRRGRQLGARLSRGQVGHSRRRARRDRLRRAPGKP